MSDASSQFGNCSNFTKEELATVTLTFGVNGGVCCFLACLLTLLLLINKSYHTVLQRLLLYLLVATILNELFITASVEHYFEYSVQEKVCTWIGFLSTWAMLLRSIFTAGIMIYLCFLVWFLTKESTVTRFLRSKCCRVSLEIVYLTLSPSLTLAYALGPYFTNNYGLSGAWCWIRTFDSNCEVPLSSLLSQLFHGYVFFAFNCIIGIVLTILTAVAYFQFTVILRIENHNVALVFKKVSFVITCFFLYAMIHTIEFADHMAMFKENYHQHLAILYIVAVTYPIGILLLPVAYIVGFYSARKLCKVFFCQVYTCLKGVDSMIAHRGGARSETTLGRSSRLRTSATCTRFSVPSFTMLGSTLIIPSASGGLYGSMASHSVAPQVEVHNDSVHIETECGGISSCEENEASPHSPSSDKLVHTSVEIHHDNVMDNESDCEEGLSPSHSQSPDIITCAAKELDTAPTFIPPREPCPPKQTYLPAKSKSSTY